MRRLVLLTAVLALVLLSCGGTETSISSSPSAATTVPGVVGGTEIVAATGGTVASADGNVVVQIPAGALTEDVAISVTRLDPSDWPDSFSDGTVIGDVYDLQPSGLTFTEPVTINHRITEAAAGLDFDVEVPLALLVVMSDDGVGELATNQVLVRDGDDLSQTGTLDHFSVTALFAGLIKVRFTPNYLQIRVDDVFYAVTEVTDRTTDLSLRFSAEASGAAVAGLGSFSTELGQRFNYVCSEGGDGRYGVKLRIGQYPPSTDITAGQNPPAVGVDVVSIDELFDRPPPVADPPTIGLAVMTGTVLCREKPSSPPPGTRVEITTVFAPTADTSANCGAEFTDTLDVEFGENGAGTIAWLEEPERLPFTMTDGILLAEVAIPGEAGLDSLWRYEISVITGEIAITYELVPPESGLGCAYSATVDPQQLAAQLFADD